VAALAALAAWEGYQAEASTAAHWSVAATIIGVVVVTVAAGRARQRTRSSAWLAEAARSGARWRARPAYAAGVALWALLLFAVVAWDLNSFAHQAHDLPTLSYYVGRVTRFTWGRELLFAAWLAAGVGIALGCRSGRATGSAKAEQ